MGKEEVAPFFFSAMLSEHRAAQRHRANDLTYTERHNAE